MLVITRKENESILIGDNIEIIISEISKEKVKIAINAPKDISILRKELVDTKELNKQASIAPKIEALNELKKLLK